MTLKPGAIVAPGGNEASLGDISDSQSNDTIESEGSDEFASEEGSDDHVNEDVRLALGFDAADSDGGQEEDLLVPSDADAAQDASDADVSDSMRAPGTVDPTHLRLWLTADRGVTCASGRVTRWADQSANHADATLMNHQLGPQCQITPTPHVVNGVDLPYFSASAVDGSFVIDETLDVDLGFLVGSDYTIFVVERRWSDNGGTEGILGTTVPPSVEEAGFQAWCQPNPRNTALAFGYSYAAGAAQIALSQGCTGGILANAASVPKTPPIGLSEETASLDQTRGHEVWSLGTPVGADYDTEPLHLAAGGAIGRCDFATNAIGIDPRFQGDIAEVLVYEAALSDANRTAVEAYLKGHWQY